MPWVKQEGEQLLLVEEIRRHPEPLNCLRQSTTQAAITPQPPTCLPYHSLPQLAPKHQKRKYNPPIPCSHPYVTESEWHFKAQNDH
jgi:hypothetical protein